MDHINNLIKQAMKSKDQLSLNILKLVKAELQSNEKLGSPKKDIEVIRAFHKKMKKSEQYFSGDQLDHLQKELAIVEGLLPKEISPEALSSVIETFCKENPSLTMGETIKAIREATKSSNGKLIASLVSKEKK